MSEPQVRRDRTAIKRHGLSRPMQLALESGLIREGSSIFDYGCGRGDDVRLLKKRGYEASGWDPAHRKTADRVESDFVNLGYVLNVIEEPAERAATLSGAWDLTQQALVVSVRLYTEVRSGKFREYRDGYLSERATFQKFYTQAELRNWTNRELGIETVSLAPGIIVAFKDDSLKHSFLASRFRRPTRPRVVRRSDELFDDHEELLVPLMDFFRSHGRLPVEGELGETRQINRVFGSLKKAFHVVRTATGKEEWEEAAEERRQDLLVFLALDRFGGRPKFSALPSRLRADMRAFFGAYSRGWRAADQLLFSSGVPAHVDSASRCSPLGKLTREALYVHTSAVSQLPPVLRVFEGCARIFIGAVDGANVVKIYRREPRVAYLSYEQFDRKPHPPLRRSLLVRLDDLSASITSFERTDNPPILHRKELLVPTEYPHRGKFARLTKQEERRGLLGIGVSIGRQRDWERLLSANGLRLRGHRVVKSA